MQVALKAGSPQKQRKTIENFLRRQEAHQKRKEANIRLKRIERDRSQTGRSKSRRRDRSRTKSRSITPTRKPRRPIDDIPEPVQLTIAQVKKKQRVERLNSYIDQLRDEDDHEVADEYEDQLNFHLQELKRIEKKIREQGKSASTLSSKSGYSSPSKRRKVRSPRKKSTNKPSYRGGGRSNYIPVQYRKLKEK
jgi:hypothetical protein